MKTNVIKLNILHLNTVRINGRVEMQGVSLQAGEIPEPPVVTTYTLAANVSNGKVTATKNGTAISLPYVATEGDVIVLSVTPDEGYEFKGWLDGNKSNPRTVTMTGNVVLSASCVEIAKPTYTLSASVTNGKVSAKRNGSAVNLPFTANEGDTIVISVQPNEGYEFNGWNDGVTDNPRTITMNADVALSAQCVEVVQPPVGKYIQFEDPAVEAICVANWSSDGIGLTEEDAAKVTDIANKFAKNSSITSFNELEYFVGLTAIGGNYADWTYGFKGCTNLKSVVLPKSVTTLKHGAFDGCTSLESVGDMSHITTTQTRVFYNCSSLAIEVNMPNLNNLGGASFYGSGISKVISLGNITELPFDYERGCFRGCAALTFVELSEKTTSIAAYSFYGCTALETFICRATTPPTLANVNAFTNTNNCPIYVPDASLEAYKTATNWNNFSSRIKPLSELSDE